MHLTEKLKGIQPIAEPVITGLLVVGMLHVQNLRLTPSVIIGSIPQVSKTAKRPD